MAAEWNGCGDSALHYVIAVDSTKSMRKRVQAQTPTRCIRQLCVGTVESASLQAQQSETILSEEREAGGGRYMSHRGQRWNMEALAPTSSKTRTKKEIKGWPGYISNIQKHSLLPQLMGLAVLRIHFYRKHPESSSQGVSIDVAISSSRKPLTDSVAKHRNSGA